MVRLSISHFSRGIIKTRNPRKLTGVDNQSVRGHGVTAFREKQGYGDLELTQECVVCAKQELI